MNGPLPLSVALITLNEAENLPRCLGSIRGLAAEIIVIDSGSTDRTKEIAESFGARFRVNPWPGHVAQKNVALEACTQPWVLCIDADEAVSVELAGALKQIFAGGEPAAEGYYINRANFYLGRWIRHSWNPEWRLRLVRRGAGKWGGLDPHDKLEVPGRTERLSGDLLHYPFDSVTDHLETELRYARIMAESYQRTGRSASWPHVVFSPLFAFLKVVLLKGGWLDGWRGWFIGVARGLNTFAKYVILLEKRRALNKRKPVP